MKKTYTKPDIVFESFIMSTNIAGDCEAPFVKNPTKGACGVPGNGGLMIFNGSFCNSSPEDMGGVADRWDGLCYDVPTADQSLFNS